MLILLHEIRIPHRVVGSIHTSCHHFVESIHLLQPDFAPSMVQRMLFKDRASLERPQVLSVLGSPDWQLSTFVEDLHKPTNEPGIFTIMRFLLFKVVKVLPLWWDRMEGLQQFIWLSQLVLGYYVGVHPLDLALVVAVVPLGRDGLGYMQISEGAASHFYRLILIIKFNTITGWIGIP